MKYEHLNFIMQNYENSATTTLSNKYNNCTIVTSPVYIGSKIEKEKGHNMSYKFEHTPSQKFYKPAHPHCLIRVFAVLLMKLWILGNL